jgi:hypothetical protein
VIAASFEARAAKREVDAAALAAELVRTRPLSVIMAERIEALRDWAADRAVYADDRTPGSAADAAKCGSAPATARPRPAVTSGRRCWRVRSLVAGGVLFFDWPAFTVMALFWLENVPSAWPTGFACC